MQQPPEPGRKANYFPLHFLAFSGDFMLAAMIVGAVVSATAAGAAPGLVGLVGASYGISYMVSPAVLGKVSDRAGRFSSLLVAMGGYVIVAILLAVLHRHVAALIACQVVSGMLYGFFWPSMEAYTSELARDDGSNHQQRITHFCIAWSAGYMLGPFLAPALADAWTALPFLLNAGFAVANVIVILTCLPRRAATTAPGPAVMALTPPSTPDGAGRRVVATLVLLIFTYSFTKGFLIGTFPDIATRPEFLSWSGLQAGTALLSFGLFRTITFALQGRLKSDSLGARVLVSLALSCTCFLLLFSMDYLYATIVLGVFGVFSGLVYAMTLDKLMQVTAEGKGQAAGLFESAIGLGGMASPLAGGLALQLGGPALAFGTIGLLSIGLSLAAMVMAGISRKRERKG